MDEHRYCYRYPHPAVTADCVIFGFDGVSIKVLLIQRGIDPYKGKWALPGGFMNIDESAEECARRELEEETGASAENFIDLGILDTTPALIDEKIHMFMAVGLSYGEMHLDEDEFLSVHKIPMTELIEMVMKGEIRDAKTQIAILKATRILGIN